VGAGSVRFRTCFAHHTAGARLARLGRELYWTSAMVLGHDACLITPLEPDLGSGPYTSKRGECRCYTGNSATGRRSMENKNMHHAPHGSLSTENLTYKLVV
jgi:hypothetical protein